jgi:hypothetical protein
VSDYPLTFKLAQQNITTPAGIPRDWLDFEDIPIADKWIHALAVSPKSKGIAIIQYLQS